MTLATSHQGGVLARKKFINGITAAKEIDCIENPVDA
jgi:hypothetical protein